MFYLLLVNAAAVYFDTDDRYTYEINGGDLYISNSYIHDFGNLNQDVSAIVITRSNSDQWLRSLYIDRTSMSTCKANRNVISIADMIHINFKFICIYNNQATVEGAVMTFSSQYKIENGGEAHKMEYCSLSENKGTYWILSVEKTANEECDFEFKNSNVSHTTITRSSVDPADIGCLRFLSFSTDIYQNTFANNKVGACGVLYYYGYKGTGSKIIHRCNVADNVDTQSYIFFLDACYMTVNDCSFLRNVGYGNRIIVSWGSASITVTNCYFDTSQGTFVDRGNGGRWSTSNIRNNIYSYPLTQWSTRQCYAQIPFPPPSMSPPRSLSPSVSYARTPFETPPPSMSPVSTKTSRERTSNLKIKPVNFFLARR